MNDGQEILTLEWQSTFPGTPGWYWIYQALPKGNGESIVPVWVETTQSLPMYATAFYGPLTPPEIPLSMRPLEYQEKIRAEEDTVQ